MSSFSWLEELPPHAWRTAANGCRLAEMTWSEFSRRSSADVTGIDLVAAFRAWAAEQPDRQYALTWNIPVTASSALFVCMEQRRAGPVEVPPA